MPTLQKKQTRFLIIDDEETILHSIDTALQLSGFSHTTTCSDSREVITLLEKNDYDVVLLDLNMPYINGEKLLETINADQPDISVIIITGVLDAETAVRCMKKGAYDYIFKPVEEDSLLSTIEKAITFRELKTENRNLKKRLLSTELEHPDVFNEIKTTSRNMRLLFDYVEAVSQSSQPILVTGETGVGKELFANAVYNLSGVKGELVIVNVAGLEDNVFSDTLFGHAKGAFTGAETIRPGLIEKAAGGMLFLDEIGDLAPASQVKLLRLLQENEYLPLGMDTPKKTDARIIVATNRNLIQLQSEDKFRKDLFYRLITHQIDIPPLRDRIQDIQILTDHFIDEASDSFNKSRPDYPTELIELLMRYNFPGNVRELRAMIFDAVSRDLNGLLSLDSFNKFLNNDLFTGITPDQTQSQSSESIQFGRLLPTIKEATGTLVLEAMKRAENKQAIAAKTLGISHQALSKRLQNMKNADPEK